MLADPALFADNSIEATKQDRPLSFCAAALQPQTRRRGRGMSQLKENQSTSACTKNTHCTAIPHAYARGIHFFYAPFGDKLVQFWPR